MDASRDSNEAPRRKSQISKIDIILLVILWVITAWGIAAECLISDENTYMSERSKFYISISIPIATSAAALLKSIQVGMEIKSEHVAEREHQEAINNINAGTVIIEQPAHDKEQRRCSRHHSVNDEIEESLKPLTRNDSKQSLHRDSSKQLTGNEEITNLHLNKANLFIPQRFLRNNVMPQRPHRNILKNVDERNCQSLPTLKLDHNLMLTIVEDDAYSSYEESYDESDYTLSSSKP